MGTLRRLAAGLLIALAIPSTVSSQGAWIGRRYPNSPSPRADAAMAYDSVRQRTVLFGGTNWVMTFDDTWEWDGMSWVQQSPAHRPSARHGHAMAFDPTRGRVVLFGGEVSYGPANDTWEWDGSDWTQQTSLTSPPSRRKYHGMAYDPFRRCVFLFGGTLESAPYANNETWIWTGTNWEQRLAQTSPFPRVSLGLVHDEGAGNVVLFGGMNGSGAFFSDTWVWDGIRWTQRPVPGPLARTRFEMAYDSVRRRVVLFGGWTYWSGPFADCWEWDATSWSRNPTVNTPSARSGHKMAFDTARQKVVLFGAAEFSDHDTWTYPENVAASYAGFGSGCAGSAGVPALQPLGASLPWLSERFTLVFSNVPAGTPVLAMLGFSNTGWGQTPLPLNLSGAGMPGCWLLATPDFVGLAQAAGNSVPWSVDLCRCPELVGLGFYNQGFVYDPTANAAGMTSTNGGAGVIGIR